MSRRSLHHLWTRIRPIKTWYLFAAFVLCAAVCVFALRSNYSNMVRLRQAVYQADLQNDPRNGGVEQALQQLRAYVSGHMNTDLATDDGVYPPIQLANTYKQLQASERARVNAVNAQVYTDAQAHCEALYPGSFSGGPRVPCIEQYVKDKGAGVKKIPSALYMFDFVSPRWSPDLAGWSMVLAVIFLGLAIIRFAIGLWIGKN